MAPASACVHRLPRQLEHERSAGQPQRRLHHLRMQPPKPPDRLTPDHHDRGLARMQNGVLGPCVADRQSPQREQSFDIAL